MNVFRLLRTLPLALVLLFSPAIAEQGTIVGPIAGPHTMTDVMGTINAAFLAIQTHNSGTAAPANGTGGAAVHYQTWCNTTANPVICNYYDGASWVPYGSLDTAAHLWTPYYLTTPLGTASIGTTGTSGHTIPFLDGTVTVSGIWTFSSGDLHATSPAFVTPSLGAATATSINGNIWTAGTGTLTIGAGKTATFSNTLTFTGTDGTSFALPGSTDTLVGLTVAQTLTNKTLTNPTINAAALSGTITGTPNYSGANFITNANLVQGASATLKGNPSATNPANEQSFTIQGLTNTTPNATLDFFVFYNHTTGTLQSATASQIATAIGSGVTSLNTLTGALSIVAGNGITVTPSGTNITVAVQNWTSAGSWTPADGSGAGLTFTAVSAGWSQIGNMVFAYASVTYPSTANASQAVISGFPVNFPAAAYGRQCHVTAVSSSNSSPITLHPNSSGATATFKVQETGGIVTNANLSLASVYWICTYPAT